MLLGGAADAIGYYHGAWEFQQSSVKIHRDAKKMGGIAALDVRQPKWIVSDDTVMHLATAEAIVEYGKLGIDDLKKLYLIVAKHYVVCMTDMTGRAPGLTCCIGAAHLKPDEPDGYIINFDSSGGGCGAAMRTMCVGMYFPKPEQLESLVAVSIECARMTHNHPTGYLGSLATALFTSYAIQAKALNSWGAGLIETLNLAWQYVKNEGRDVEKNEANLSYFRNAWTKYLNLRGIADGKSSPVFPENFGVEERDEFYKKISYNGRGGASGHDAPMIAYDALLASGSSWKELSDRALFHGGDNDSTGHIAGVWYGILYGIRDVPVVNYQNVEYRNRLEAAGENIFNLVENLFD
ncbi:hypothetical protein HELRODRAFT_65081 [Helobdella robusta]|uniref:ADP-ribosylhydrolase ARH1 n=1 Tax=Helobdella robusta TaxID=6412 RepID=T1FY31_HELRO|nr:hypothetical protein HELRODRAFT_65081 [Helobdella robusta]ESO02295.1 hypothetical protein HELRODRAFT_65081 [Helobdella robusta]